jgi:hypothetical protein
MKSPKNSNNEFHHFIKKFSDEMGIPLSEVLSNPGLLKVLEEMFSQGGNKKEKE